VVRAQRRDGAVARHALPAMAILTGGACMALHWGLGAEYVWVAAGAFFLSVGVGAYVLSAAWAAQGVLGKVLRSPGISLIVLLAVLGTLVWTVLLGLGALWASI
jgi:hypothetical protein